MVHVCVSEAYAYVITSKQVVKSLCQLWAGSAMAWVCSEPVSALRHLSCTREVLYCLEQAEVCRLWSLGGLQKVATRREFSYFHIPFFVLFCYLHYAGKRREISKLKQQNKTTKQKNPCAFISVRQNIQVWNVPIYNACQRINFFISKFAFACLTTHPALLW